MLEDGNEMDEGIMFPGDLNKENVLKFTFLLLEVFDFFHKENIEVQVRHCFDHKAIEWNIKTFYFEKGFCLDKIYSFILLPNWLITSIYEHSYNNQMVPLCKKVINSEKDEVELDKRMEVFLNELKLYYQKTGKQEANYFLNTDTWRVIFAKSFKSDQANQAEKRIHHYFNFLKNPVSNLKNG